MTEGDISRMEKIIHLCDDCKFATCKQCEINYGDVYAIKHLYEENKKQQKEIKVLKEMHNEHVKELENKDKELETYKKIAEKLAEHISKRCYYTDGYSNTCDVIEDSCYEDKDCKQCIIDWAKREVENEQNNNT